MNSTVKCIVTLNVFLHAVLYSVLLIVLYNQQLYSCHLQEGHSAVHYAASGGHSATIRLLVARGLDPNLKSKARLSI